MTETTVAIIVYNRIENLRTWLICWNMCNKENTDFVVVHNYDKASDQPEYKSLCEKHNVRYVPRPNRGFDIGALKDFIPTCKSDKLIWITDDTIPMKKGFVRQFTEKLNGNIGIACMEISSIRSPLHVRTTGFCIIMDLARKLVFPDKINTKQDCYHFEHRGGKMTMMQQVISMGYRCIQICPISVSPLWDTGNRAHLNRHNEHRIEFIDGNGIGDKVIVICPVYQNYPAVISSLIAQTHQNWELYLVHDGHGEIELPKDRRIHFECTKERVGNWGHSIRAEYLQKLKDKGEYVIISNVDNYYAPVFMQRALECFRSNPTAVAVYCRQIIHSYTNWEVMNCRLQRGFIDCGQVMLKMPEASSVGWKSNEHSADWFFFNDIANSFGRNSFVPFKGALFVHN